MRLFDIKMTIQMARGTGDVYVAFEGDDSDADRRLDSLGWRGSVPQIDGWRLADALHPCVPSHMDG